MWCATWRCPRGHPGGIATSRLDDGTYDPPLLSELAAKLRPDAQYRIDSNGQALPA
ncbi:MAG TPA: hypothetical protein VKZ89_01920 [Thermobifida alba]|nr:hypothetical protein [Thermobifida alba]